MIRHQELKDSELKSLPRFQLAVLHERLLKKTMIVCLLIAGSFLGILWFGRSEWLAGLQRVLVVQAAALLVVTACLHAAWRITRWRIRALGSEVSATSIFHINNSETGASETHNSETSRSEKVLENSQPNDHLVSSKLVSHSRSARFARFQFGLGVRGLTCLTLLKKSGNAVNVIIGLLLPALSTVLIFKYWNLPTGDLEKVLVGQIPAKFLVIIGLVVAAFAALVFERHFVYLGHKSQADRSHELPEAPHITYQLRVYITLTLLLCIALLLATESRQWPLNKMLWLGLLPAAIASEFLLRELLSFFTPPNKSEPELLAKSFLASFWRWPIKPFSQLQDELKQRFGIDLRQSWAFAYIRRSLLPVLGVLLGIAWLLSGLVEIPMAERGIYERFGAPVAVWQPGIHAGLPWPFGRVQRIENGVVHELSATTNEVSKGANGQAKTIEVETIPPAEAATPASANRLWDASHLAEKSQIIASEVTTAEGNRQSFHIVNMDVRFMYRIGLNDEAALKARYTSADAEALIRSTANRILVRYFASRTLEGVLGEARTRMAKDIGAQLQADLDLLNSGVEIMTTVLEAIHPPAAAANAYHAVQAAQIKARSIIARERGNAAQQINLAQLRAGISRNQANANARETLATAEVANRRFAAERDAYQQGGKAFLMEQYFAQLIQGLKSARVLLVDHRLPHTGATIDLRDFASTDKKSEMSPALAPRADYQESP